MDRTVAARVCSGRGAWLACALILLAGGLPSRAGDVTPPPRAVLALLSGEAGSPSGLDFSSAFHEAFVGASQSDRRRLAEGRAWLATAAGDSDQEPSLWRDHYGLVLAASMSLVALSGLVIGLVAERRRRLVAEAQGHASLNEVSFMNRRAALGELTASIAHEINQPLGAILNNAEAADILLGMDPPPFDEVRDAVRAIRDDDLRAGEIVRRLRALLSRGGTEHAAVDVRRLIADTFALLRSDALGSHVQLAADVAGHPVASGDSTQLRQVLLNVCLNGIDAMRGSSAATRHLTVSAREDPRGIVIAVADQGGGFSPDAIARAFEAFYTTKEARSGMGMGLAITKRIIEAHEGTISIANNAPGPGATVTIVLPAHAHQ